MKSLSPTLAPASLAKLDTATHSQAGSAGQSGWTATQCRFHRTASASQDSYHLPDSHGCHGPPGHHLRLCKPCAFWNTKGCKVGSSSGGVKGFQNGHKWSRFNRTGRVAPSDYRESEPQWTFSDFGMLGGTLTFVRSIQVASLSYSIVCLLLSMSISHCSCASAVVF